MRLLEGHVEPSDERDELIDRLERENRELRDELQAAKREVRTARSEAAGALSALRKQLSPLYRALQAVFGELDAVGVEESAPTQPARTSAVWESWKQRLPGRPAQIIDALLLHGALNTTQIGVVIGMSRNNVPAVIFKLNKAGILQKSGDKFSLKSLAGD